MKRFILRSLLASFSFMILGLSIYLAIHGFLKSKAVFKLDRPTKYLVVGHSHPECAFNDSLISNLSNLGLSGESYFYTLFKTRQIIEQNPDIETVFVEFTNNQIAPNMDGWIWDNEHLSQYPLYAPFMGFDDNLLLCQKNFGGYMNTVSVSIKQNFSRIKSGDFNYVGELGGYRYLIRDFADSLSKYKPSQKRLVR